MTMTTSTTKAVGLRIKEFNEYFAARVNFKNKLQDAYECLSQFKGKRIKIEGKQTIKLLSKEFDQALCKELNLIKKRLNKDLELEKISLFVDVLRFVWTHPQKMDDLIINKSVELVNFNGSYKAVTTFTFSGELGDLITNISQFDSNLLSFSTKNEGVEIKHQMSLAQLRSVLCDNFVSSGNEECIENILRKVLR